MAGAFSAVIQSMPVQLAQVADPGSGDHPPVADHDQALDAEVAADPGDRGLERLGVAGVAGEHLDGDRAAFGVGEQPVFDLLAAALAVAGVPERGQLAAEPSTQEEDRSNIAIPPGRRWRAASFFSISRCREVSQSIAA